MIIQRHGLDCGCFSFCFFVFSGQHWLFKLGSESPAGGERHSWYPCIGSALWGAVSARVSFSFFVFYSVTFKSVTMEHVTSDCFFFCVCFFFKFHRAVFCILTITWCPQDMCVCAGCDHQDQAGLWGTKTVRLGCSQTQSQDAVARHSRRSGHAADLWTFFSTEHAQSKLGVHQLPPQQRERVSTKYVAHCLCFVTMFSKTIEIYVLFL